VGATGEGWMTSDFNMARIDLFYKSLSLDQTPPDTWVKQGSPSWCNDMCREKLKEFEKHEPVPMPKDIAERMDAILKEGTALLKRQDGSGPTGSNKPI
jgi:trimethylamine:corrinoid methyltransferase-like protein